MSDKLDSYKAKRDFSATPEPGAEDRPAAEVAPSVAGGTARFVVQEHHARRLHWDLRLERDGVLASWALPKGVPPDPKVNHLAVPTEDHPLSYLDFAGTSRPAATAPAPCRSGTAVRTTATNGTGAR